ncbi:hypothetical protein CTEN210_18459 [Chaetoceros tenuissimus]|uniref:Uncharacterized protein n=1 Tax=Chaetoceros tenuissimus TaxID=426638 RepID=A0AAD3HGB6_9STRA|nr:hypothetical protein CTEN210_18459 [Chaetoceros tenuissimus]
MNISTFQGNLDFIKSLYLLKEWNDEKCRNEILEALEEANAKIKKALGRSMHRLGWRKHKPSIEAVEKVANKFPSTLSFPNGSGSIPIQSAATTCDGYEYVPILAKEGVKHKVGGEDARGGLLMLVPYENLGWNTLQWFVNVSDDDEFDTKKVHVLKELRKLDLLVKVDIQEQKLFLYCCSNMNKLRFEYLANWDPDALIETRTNRNVRLTHCKLSEENLLLILKAGFQYHPHIGGLLFVKDDEGNTAFDALCNGKGTANIMSLLHQILSTKRDYPILHHVLVKAPQHRELFMSKFPWAYHLKDHNGRALHQAVLAAGPDVMNANKQLFASLSDEQIQEKDPMTTLFPFAAMAVGEHADLDQCFYLLRRHPSVLEKRSRVSVSRSSKKRKIREIED